MRLPEIPDLYNRRIIQEAFREVESFADMAQRRDQDIEVPNGTTRRLVIQSPDGTRWSVTVDNNGALQTTAL